MSTAVDDAVALIAADLAAGADPTAVAVQIAYREITAGTSRFDLADAYAAAIVHAAQQQVPDDGEVERSGVCYKDNRVPAEPGQLVDYPCGHRWGGWFEPRTAELPRVPR